MTSTTRPGARSVLGFVQIPAMNLHPGLDVLGQPHLALSKIGDRLRKVRTAGDLVRALAAHPAQANADLVRAHEADRLHSHMIDRRRETIRHSATCQETSSRRSASIILMTRCRTTTGQVPHSPGHRRDWRTLWRRCRCGLPAPCVDRLVPSPPMPYPARGLVPLQRTAPAQHDKKALDRQRPRMVAPPPIQGPPDGRAESRHRQADPQANQNTDQRTDPLSRQNTDLPDPRTRHEETNVGRAGQLTPGQRHRTRCNDPFKDHPNRRRDQR
jgi:hypothetical protein